MQTWSEANEYEKAWHADCVNSYQEESKQISYATRMGLTIESRDGRYPVIDFHGRSVIDIGGGPYSLLLKGINLKGTVVDPLDMPQWCKDRYKAVGIEFIQEKAEEFDRGHYDIGLIYNCLQHTSDPKKIIENIRKTCDIIYIHEWLDTPISDGHIQTIRELELNEWLDAKVMVGQERWSDTVVTPYAYGMFLC